MRVIRKQCEQRERSDEEEAVNNGSWKELSEVLDDCNIQEERLDEANDTPWKCTTQLLMSQPCSTGDEDCHNHRNEVHDEEYVKQNKILHIC